MSELFTVLLETGSDTTGWLTFGEPETVTADLPGADPYLVALDYAFGNLPRHAMWRVRVWKGAGADVSAPPAAQVLPGDTAKNRVAMPEITTVDQRPAAAKTSTALAGVLTRLTAGRPRGAITDMVVVGRLRPGATILVTDDARNTTARKCPGPWYPAATRVGAHVAVVRQVAETVVKATTVVSLVTSFGPIDNLNPDQPVIPAATTG